MQPSPVGWLQKSQLPNGRWLYPQAIQYYAPLISSPIVFFVLCLFFCFVLLNFLSLYLVLMAAIQRAFIEGSGPSRGKCCDQTPSHRSEHTSLEEKKTNKQPSSKICRIMCTLAPCRSTVGRQSVESRPTVDRPIDRLSTDSRPTVDRLSTDCRSTVGR